MVIRLITFKSMLRAQIPFDEIKYEKRKREKETQRGREREGRRKNG